jgi:hypothetical protein
VNYIQTANPFNLATPPAWFLKALHAYDPLLVIFASVKEPLYRMGRRGRFGHGMLKTLASMPDTQIYVAHRVWPWKSILPQTLGGNWARILLDIPDYDTQRFGKDPGEHLDEVEARQERDAQKSMLSDLDHLNGETYRLMKTLTGSRVGVGARPEGAGFKKLPGKSAPSRKAPYRPRGYESAGAMFVGR